MGLAGLVLAALAAAPARLAAAPAPARPIKFARGAFSAQVRGQFTKANQAVYFTLSAKAGQHMLVNVVPQTAGLATEGVVILPNGRQDGGPGGVVFDGDLSQTGDYTIKVAQHLMASSLPRGAFLLEVIIR
jgi:hypothetical protein